MTACGLVVPKSDGSGTYDRFRERIMFPIASASGKIVAFGGRTVARSGESQRVEPKYMNSPETPVYSKSDTLYGLYTGREALRKQQFAVLVEGYLDFASLFEAGIENVVASLGTALTEGHARLLARFVECVVVNYDADPAGRSAALRSFAPLVAHGLRVKVLRLPTGKTTKYNRRIGKDGDGKKRCGPEGNRLRLEEAYRKTLDRRETRCSRGTRAAFAGCLESPKKEPGMSRSCGSAAIEASILLAELPKRFGTQERRRAAACRPGR